MILLNRSDTLHRIEVAQKCKDDNEFVEKVAELNKVLFTLYHPSSLLDDERNTTNERRLSARQYVCMRNAIAKLANRKVRDSLWEVYDIIEDGKSEGIGVNEGRILYSIVDAMRAVTNVSREAISSAKPNK